MRLRVPPISPIPLYSTAPSPLTVIGYSTYGPTHPPWGVRTSRTSTPDKDKRDLAVTAGDVGRSPAAGLWAGGVLLPMARRNHDAFGMMCAIAGAVIALVAWLLIGTGVRSQ